MALSRKLNIPIVLLFFSMIMLNCKDNREKQELIVELALSLECPDAFDSQFQKFPFHFIHEDYPEFYESLLANYKNIPFDRYYLVMAYTDSKKFIYDLNKKNLIEEKKYEKMAQRSRLDPSVEEKKTKFHSLVAVVGQIDGHNFFSVDTDNDKDFGNEKIVPYQNVSQVPMSFIDYKYAYFEENGSSTLYNRKISINPNFDFFAFQKVKDTNAKKLGIVGTFKDCWSGQFNFKNNIYEVLVQGYNNSYLEVLIKHDSLRFSRNDVVFNENFSYSFKDTVDLGNDLYILDRISNDLETIFFVKANRPQKNTPKYRIGQVVKNYSLHDLNGNVFSINDKKVKKYTLLHFWGTWCAPCKEMTPLLKNLNLKLANNINFIGVAYDKSLSETKKYVEDYDLNWEHSFINFKENNDILKELKIDSYPTLILIDNDNNKIIYRGADISMIEKISEKRF